MSSIDGLYGTAQLVKEQANQIKTVLKKVENIIISIAKQLHIPLEADRPIAQIKNASKFGKVFKGFEIGLWAVAAYFDLRTAYDEWDGYARNPTSKLGPFYYSLRALMTIADMPLIPWPPQVKAVITTFNVSSAIPDLLGVNDMVGEYVNDWIYKADTRVIKNSMKNKDYEYPARVLRDTLDEILNELKFNPIRKEQLKARCKDIVKYIALTPKVSMGREPIFALIYMMHWLPVYYKPEDTVFHTINITPDEATIIDLALKRSHFFNHFV